MRAAVQISVVAELTADDDLRQGVEKCWLDVSNDGGAVGFPFLPVSAADVSEATRRLAEKVAAGSVLLFVATGEEEIVGWVSLRLNNSSLTSHWATVERLQSHPERRGQAIGKQLMEFLTSHARSIGLEHLRLALRGGEELEAFYERLGWSEIGRHKAALRLSSGDDRDEVLMALDLTSS